MNCDSLVRYVTTQREEEMKEMSAISSKVPDAHLQTVKYRFYLFIFSFLKYLITERYLLELNVPTLAEQLLSESNDSNFLFLPHYIPFLYNF